MDTYISCYSVDTTVYLIILFDHGNIASLYDGGEIFGLYGSTTRELLGPCPSFGQLDRISCARMRDINQLSSLIDIEREIMIRGTRSARLY